MSFLTILDDDSTFEYSPLEPTTGERMETVFILRQVPDETYKEFSRKCTRPVFENHQRVLKSDGLELARLLLDYAIVDWRGVKSARSERDIPCTAEMKQELPSVLSQEIIRLCAGKEAGAELSKAAQEKKPLKPILTESKAS